MWLSKQTRPGAPTSDADMGVTTISGEQVGVVTRGEVRDLPVYGPGGYLWTPANGTAVLVVKGGPGGEEQCVAGARPPEGGRRVEPGEVYVYGPGDNAVYLRQDGSVEIRGSKVTLSGEVSVEGGLTVNGQTWEPGAD